MRHTDPDCAALIRLVLRFLPAHLGGFPQAARTILTVSPPLRPSLLNGQCLFGTNKATLGSSDMANALDVVL